jgi:arginase family enzyme
LIGRALHLNLDDAWRDEPFEVPVIDARSWGPRLRFSAPPRVVAQFYRDQEANLAAPFLLYGSGDFHYLTALRLRRIAGPMVLVSFDNHPDWDVRPPKWGCGGWVNRALELPNVQRVSVWGCGNFECWWPHQIFGNRRAERAGVLEVHPWADDRSLKDRERRGAILRDNWRARFEQFVSTRNGENVYVTIDIDCLRPKEAVTNWEAGRFTIADLEWALGILHGSSRIIGGDICGAYSEPTYVRWKQRFAAEFDHPKIQLPPTEQIRAINLAALEKLWPVLAAQL